MCLYEAFAITNKSFITFKNMVDKNSALKKHISAAFFPSSTATFITITLLRILLTRCSASVNVLFVVQPLKRHINKQRKNLLDMTMMITTSGDSSVGRASDWRSEGRVFDPRSPHIIFFPKTNYLWLVTFLNLFKTYWLCVVLDVQIFGSTAESGVLDIWT